MRLSAAIWRVEAPLRAGDGQADRGGLERGPDAAAQAAAASRPFVDPGISSMDSLNDAIDELFPAPGGTMYASFGSDGGPFSSADLGSLDVLPRADFVPQQPLEPARSGPEEPTF